MQAENQDPDGAEGPGSPCDSRDSGGPAGHEVPVRGGAGEAGAVAIGAPQASGALQAPMPGGRASPGPGEHGASELRGQDGPARRPQRQLFQYFFMVPFLSPSEAEMARQCMDAPDPVDQLAVWKEFVVLGNILAIRLSAEDPDLLEASITSCMDQISLLAQAMQHFVPTSLHDV